MFCEYLNREVREAFALSGIISAKEEENVLIIRTKEPGIIADTLNFNGFSGSWAIDYDLEKKEVIWTIQKGE